jgi:hypothetical protein
VRVSLIKKRVQESGYAATTNKRFYSRDTRSESSFAPATIQAEASPLIFAINIVVEDSRLSKVLAFHSFQTPQTIKSEIHLNALLGVSGTMVIMVHHCLLGVSRTMVIMVYHCRVAWVVRKIQARSCCPSCYKLPYMFGVSAVHQQLMSRFQLATTKNT